MPFSGGGTASEAGQGVTSKGRDQCLAYPLRPVNRAIRISSRKGHAVMVLEIAVIAPPHRRTVLGADLPRAFAMLFAMIAAASGPASANARRSAMGEVTTVRDGGAQDNVAFRAIPPLADRPRVIPLPLGLAQVALAPPTFDTNDPDFSAVEMVNLILEPPFDLRLTSPPNGSEAVIEVGVAKDEIILDLGEAQSLIPDNPFRRGGRFATDFFNSGMGFVYLGLSPLLIGRTRLDFSEDLHRALHDAQPLTSSGVYRLEPSAEAQAAMALGISLVGQVAGPRPADFEPDAPHGNAAADEIAGFGEQSGGWRLYGGAGFKPLFGIAYFDQQGTIDIFPAEPLLDPNDPTDVVVRSEVRTSIPGSPGNVGQGFALDLGLAALYGSRWELGLGVTDLAGSIRWHTEVTEVTLDQGTGELVTRTLSPDEVHTSRLTPQTTINAARHWKQLTLAADVRHGLDGTSGHLGTEVRLSRLFAVRGGAMVDGAGKIQGTGGGGVRLGMLGLDAAVASSSANLAEKRALYLGLSLALYGGR